MKKLVVIDACVREGDSRTLRIAEPIISALSARYAVTRYRLPAMDIRPLDPAQFAQRGQRFLCTWVDLVHIAWRYVLRQSCTTVA